MVVLAARSRPDSDGHRPHDCGSGRGSGLAVERAVDRFCPGGRNLLAGTHALGLPVSRGFILFWASLVTGPRLSEAVTSGTSRVASENVVAFENVSPTSDKLSSTGWLSYAHVVAFGAGVGFFALSFLVLAILPGKELEDEIKQVAPVTMPTLTASEQRGRVIYGREGCAYCHTQQIRSLAADVRRFGAPTEPGRPNMITRNFGYSPHRAGFIARIQPSSPRLATHTSL